MSEPKVGEPKEGALDPLGGKRQPSRPAPPEETREVVVTLGGRKNEVLKVEKIEKSGPRRELSEEEFAALVGEDEMEDLGAALEEAYAAGINDAINDALGELDEAEDDEEEEDEEIVLRRFILGRGAGRQLLRRGVRRLILARVLRRALSRQRPHTARKTNGKARKD
jgi:hypothetical protein